MTRSISAADSRMVSEGVVSRKNTVLFLLRYVKIKKYLPMVLTLLNVPNSTF